MSSSAVTKSKVLISKMDCPSEIKIIESSIENKYPDIVIEFDLSTQSACFYHRCEIENILDILKKINLPGKLLSTAQISKKEAPVKKPSIESKTLIILLLINLIMFFVEVFLGLISSSTGLIADGLDMLADAFVYGVSLYAVHRSIKAKKRAALISGIAQISLGVLCIAEVTRKFIYGSEPLSTYMILVSVIALAANLTCLALIYKHKDGEVHMKASWIFSANDVLVNLSVIFSGLLVYFLDSNYPDLAVGTIVSIVVIRGGFSIVKMSKE